MEYEEMHFSKNCNAHGKILQNFVNHILYGEELISVGFDALEEVALCNGAYLSSWEGRWVSFPFENRKFDEHLEKRVSESSYIEKNNVSKNECYQERWQVRW